MAKRKYTVADNGELQYLCIKNRWFTCGTSRQYGKLFLANENGWSIKDLALMIWLCSEDVWTVNMIVLELERLNREYYGG